MEINGWWVAAIILLALGVIVSNLMLLKYSAKLKWPTKEELTDPLSRANKHSSTQKSDEH